MYVRWSAWHVVCAVLRRVGAEQGRAGQGRAGQGNAMDGGKDVDRG
jgi:hypothetical protein